MNHVKAAPNTLNHDLRQSRRVVWSVLSNAAERLSKTSAVGSPCDSEMNLEGPVLYADCSGLSRLFLLICCKSCLTTMQSTNFDMKCSPDTS